MAGARGLAARRRGGKGTSGFAAKSASMPAGPALGRGSAVVVAAPLRFGPFRAALACAALVLVAVPAGAGAQGTGGAAPEATPAPAPAPRSAPALPPVRSKARLSRLACASGCAEAGAVRPGAVLRVRGVGLRRTAEVGFGGAAGTADDVAAAPVRRRRTFVDVRVPLGAVTGPVRVLDRDGVASAPAPVPLSVVPATPVTGGPSIDVDVHAPKAYFDARRPIRVAYVVHDDRPVEVRVELVRQADGAVVASWSPGVVAPETPQVVQWNGLAGGRVQRPGRYGFRVTAADEAGALRASSAQAEEPPGEAAAPDPSEFVFLRHQFPIRGPHGYGEYAAAPLATAFPLPDDLDESAALALLIQGLTAWHLYRTAARLRAGESVLVVSAAGGVGSLAVQLARPFGAGRVIAMASSEEKRRTVLSLGADAAVDPGAEDLGSALLEANGGERLDVVLEMAGGQIFEAGLDALAPFGRLVVYGIAGREQNEVATGGLMRGSKAVVGFWLRHCLARPEMLGEPLRDLFERAARGELKPLIGGIYPLADAARAHRDLEARRTSGKLLLDPCAR